MEIQFQEGIQAEITCIPNTFIDEYVAEANGDYVKVYLYLLRHQKEKLKGKEIGEALLFNGSGREKSHPFLGEKGGFKRGNSQSFGAGIAVGRGCSSFRGEVVSESEDEPYGKDFFF